MTTRVTNVIIAAGAHGAIPAAATTPEGALFSCTDHDKVYRNNGTTWDDWADLTGTAASTLTTKGDLLTRDGTALDRLPVGGSNGLVLTVASGEDTGLKWSPHPEYIQVALSDETTDITTGVKISFRMPFAMTLTAVRASLADASSAGGPVTVDIKEAGVSILSTLITIDDGEKTSTTAATPPVISDTALADDAEITMEVTDAGTDAKGLKVTLIGTR